MITGQQFYLTFTLAEVGNANFLPNTPFTCTAYDNGTLLGSATAVSGGSGNVAAAGCYIAAPAFSHDPSAAMIVLTSAAVNPGDTYTFILSH